MRLMLEEEYIKICTIEDYRFKSASDIDMKLYRFTRNVKSFNGESLASFLNNINTQGIESVDFIKLTYKRGGIEIPLYDLSGSEKIFYVTWIAVNEKIPVFIDMGVYRLSKKVRNLYLRYLLDNDKNNYVTLVFKESSIKDFYKGRCNKIC